MKIRYCLISLIVMLSITFPIIASSEPYVDLVTYEYDGQNRLVRAQSGEGIGQEFAHDRVANRISEIRRDAPEGAPRTRSDAYSLAQGQTLVTTSDNGLLTNDTFNASQTVTASLVTSTLFGSISLAQDGSFTYQPNPGFFGDDEFAYQLTASDTGFSSNIVRVNLTVLPTNPQPIANEDIAITAEDTGVLIPVLLNDQNVSTIVSVDTPFNGTAQIESGQILYTPNQNYSGQDVFNYAAQGPEGVASARVVVTVEPSNDAPQAFSIDSRIVFGGTATFPVLVNVIDPEGDDIELISVTNTDGSQNPALLISNGVVNYTPTEFIPTNNAGTVMLEQFSYTVRDTAGNESQGTLLNFTFENVAPVAVVDCFSEAAAQGCVNNSEYEIEPATPTLLNVLGNDFDVGGEALSISQITDSPNRGTAIIQNGLVLYTPLQGQSNVADNFEYEIIDDFGNTSRANVFVFIQGVDNTDNAPIARDDCFDSNSSPGCGASDDYLVDFGEDAVLNVLLNDIDPNGETLEIVSVTNSSQGGSVSQSGNTVVYSAPTSGSVNGFQDAFTYTIRNTTSNLTSEASVFLRIKPRDNVAPVARNDNFIVIRDRARDLNLVSNDTDANFDTLTIDPQSLSTPNNGTVSVVAPGVVRYTPLNNAEGGDVFTYRAVDPDGELSGTASVIINIRPLPPLVPIYDLLLFQDDNTPVEGQ